MIVLDHQQYRELAAKIFEAAGAPAGEAWTVSDMLVDAELMGLSSHGLQRIPQYIQDIRNGAIRPGVQVLVDRRSPTTALVDGQWNFGQVAARRATEEAIAIARKVGTGCVVVRGCRHVGRLGAYTELCAANACIGLALASGGNEGHWVAPFGGREGRLSTNPISFAVPTQGDPVVLDFSTSSLPEGKVRLIRDHGEKLPGPLLVNAEGKPSDNPWDLYDEKTGERSGAILPFGGSQGYKGYGLGLMAQVLASSLANPIWSSTDIRRFTNGLWLLAIRIDSFMDDEEFRADVQAMATYVKSAAPAEGSGGVLLPGEQEFQAIARRRRDGLPIHESIWRMIVDAADSLGIEAPAGSKD
jgi:uncharacterized oxidoreductase